VNKKERSKYASELGKRSWKARKKHPRALEHLRKIASKGGKARWKKMSETFMKGVPRNNTLMPASYERTGKGN